MSAKKCLVLYHANCRDGFSAAWAVWKKFKHRAEYVGVKRGEKLPVDVKNKNVILLDFVYQREIMEQIVKNAAHTTALDHHISARYIIKSADEYVYDLDHSGAVIAWKYFHPKKKVPALLLYVEAYDLWKFNKLYTREISAYLDSEKLEFHNWSRLQRAFQSKKRIQEFAGKGTLLLEQQDIIVDSIVRGAEKVKFAGYTVLAVNSPIYMSEVGSRLCEICPPFAIIWSERRGRIKASLRASGTYDVSKLAARYGGGGHKAAASFILPVGKKVPWKRIKK